MESNSNILGTNLAVNVRIQVRQSNGSPASLAIVQFYKHVCVWFACFNNYQFQLMTDLTGQCTVSLDTGDWHLRGLLQSQEGEADFTLTASGPGTVKQSGALILMAYKA